MKTLVVCFISMFILSFVGYSQEIKEVVKDSTNLQKKLQKIKRNAMSDKFEKSETEWKGCLSPEEYRVLREKGTEMAFTGKYYKHKEKGVYVCAACGNELFSSESKYDSGSGWPSYWQPISEEAVEFKKDASLGMERTEVLCGKCGSHLGHVFEDGPKPTGLRYCINSVSLDFEKDDK